MVPYEIVIKFRLPQDFLNDLTKARHYGTNPSSVGKHRKDEETEQLNKLIEDLESSIKKGKQKEGVVNCSIGLNKSITSEKVSLPSCNYVDVIEQ
jgi:ribose 5-phosphate isomerase RpiB